MIVVSIKAQIAKHTKRSLASVHCIGIFASVDEMFGVNVELKSEIDNSLF